MDNVGAMSEPPQLDSVQAFDAAGDFEGGRWWVTAVERWRDATALQYVVWTQESMLNNPPGAYRGFTVSLADDLGPLYQFAGGGSGSGGLTSRGHQEFQTAVPPTAGSLVATLHRLTPETQDTQPIASITLRLDPHSA